MSKYTFLVREEVSRSNVVDLEVPDSLVVGSLEFDEYVTDHVYALASSDAEWHTSYIETDWEATT